MTQNAGGLGRVLIRALRGLVKEQLPTGEMASYFQIPEGGLEYLRSPLASTYVHDVLSCFDPTSALVETEVFDVLPAESRTGFVRTILRIRRRIRTFIAWEESCHGFWRFYGRGSGIPPDADTTACAATVLLAAPRRTTGQPWRRHVEAAQGANPSPDKPGAATRANVIRLLALVGEETAFPARALLDELQAGIELRDERYVGVALPYCLARAWSQAHLPGGDELKAQLVPWLVSRQNVGGDFGGPLSTAFALVTFIDLGYDGPEVGRARDYLRNLVPPKGRFAFEPLFTNGGGSPALTSALVIAGLARASNAERV